MNTFRNKHFKNKLDPKAVYYECIKSCGINKSTEKGVKLHFKIRNTIISFPRISIFKSKYLQLG